MPSMYTLNNNSCLLHPKSNFAFSSWNTALNLYFIDYAGRVARTLFFFLSFSRWLIFLSANLNVQQTQYLVELYTSPNSPNYSLPFAFQLNGTSGHQEPITFTKTKIDANNFTDFVSLQPDHKYSLQVSQKDIGSLLSLQFFSMSELDSATFGKQPAPVFGMKELQL